MKIKTLQLLAALAILPFLTTGCSILFNGKSVQGSGNIITQERQVSGFSKVRLKGSGKVFLTLGKSSHWKLKPMITSCR